jgi:hypothetical protein
MKKLSKRKQIEHHQRAVMRRTDERHVSEQRALDLLGAHLSRLSRAVAWLLEQQKRP